jgi:mono/diheme cytochrome c family protein
MMLKALTTASLAALVAMPPAGTRPADATAWTVARPAAPGAPARSVWDGVYTKEQAARGDQLYAVHCRECHGESLEGSGPAHALSGPVFASNWDGVSLGDMLDRTRTSMPLNKPGTLSRQQIADVLAFLLSANKMPSGEAELPRQAEVLNQIKFLATRP